MNHQGTRVIETERLILRPLCERDAEAAYRNWTGDARVTEYLTWPTHRDVHTTENLMRYWAEQYSKPDFYQWAIELRTLGEPVGTISVVDIKEELELMQLGYCIGSKWWRQGYTSEALAAILPYLFDVVGANRIEAVHDTANPNSGRVMKKCGLQYEGTLRQAGRNNHGIVDVCMFSILRSDWEARKGQGEQ